MAEQNKITVFGFRQRPQEIHVSCYTTFYYKLWDTMVIESFSTKGLRSLQKCFLKRYKIYTLIYKMLFHGLDGKKNCPLQEVNRLLLLRINEDSKCYT